MAAIVVRSLSHGAVAIDGGSSTEVDIESPCLVETKKAFRIEGLLIGI
jgi:hypothetical protein